MPLSSNNAGPADFRPAYLSLPLEKIRRRARLGLELMRPCRVCPRRCEFDHISQSLSHGEFRQAARMAREFGLQRLDRRGQTV